MVSLKYTMESTQGEEQKNVSRTFLDCVLFSNLTS